MGSRNVSASLHFHSSLNLTSLSFMRIILDPHAAYDMHKTSCGKFSLVFSILVVVVFVCFLLLFALIF